MGPVQPRLLSGGAGANIGSSHNVSHLARGHVSFGGLFVLLGGSNTVQNLGFASSLTCDENANKSIILPHVNQEV